MPQNPLPTYDGELRVAVAHDFLEAYGGAERVLEEMLQAFPNAELWTVLGRPDVMERVAPNRPTHTLLPASESLFRHFRLLAPVYPAIVRAARLPAADVLLTSSWAFANRFHTRNRAPQVCFCHSPLRFVWTATEEYQQRWARRPGTGGLFRLLAAGMRAGDRRAAGRVHRYLTCSSFVAEQIRELYGKEPVMVKAPVDTDRFRPGVTDRDGYFLFCGRLVEPYKRPGAVVEAFREVPEKRLIVAGDGPELDSLRRSAPANVTFTGRLDDHELIPLMQRCTATIFPSRDDFGLVPLEVMACGRPVLAVAEGGAMDTVKPGLSGVFLESPTAAAIAKEVRRFDASQFDASAIRAYAEQWDRRVFRSQLIQCITRVGASTERVAARAAARRSHAG